MNAGDQDPSLRPARFYPETEAIIEQLEADPSLAFECIHGDGGGAVGIFDVHGGCVVFRGVETQALCPSHAMSDGSIEGMDLVVDLTVDASWTRLMVDLRYYHDGLPPFILLKIQIPVSSL